ncbi:hypothetical protein [Streptomyces sp. NPDC046939]|uniref:hypothetical protein n=1 Tax=Streptomyces sp. NPDC046939 TaxID=3155376 RepID=UPI0033F5FF59
MTTRTTGTALAATAAFIGAGIAAASPASAGGIGDFLSPAFGDSCSNLDNGATANGTTTHGSGALGGSAGSLPLLSALNHCGGADGQGAGMLVTQNGGPYGHADVNQI